MHASVLSIARGARCDVGGDQAEQLLRGIPHSILLANDNRELFVLVPNVRVVRPLVQVRLRWCGVVWRWSTLGWVGLGWPGLGWAGLTWASMG